MRHRRQTALESLSCDFRGQWEMLARMSDALIATLPTADAGTRQNIRPKHENRVEPSAQLSRRTKCSITAPRNIGMQGPNHRLEGNNGSTSAT